MGGDLCSFLELFNIQLYECRSFVSEGVFEHTCGNDYQIQNIQQQLLTLITLLFQNQSLCLQFSV